MSWTETVPLLLVAAALLMLPGYLLARALGLRGLPAAATAPAATVTVASVLAVVLPYAGIGWSAGAVVLAALLLSAAVAAVRYALHRSGAPRHTGSGAALSRSAAHAFRGLFERPGPRTAADRSGLQAAGYLAGAALVLTQLVLAFGTPESISQTFDNVFHLNGVRYILDTGDASSLTMTTMTSGDDPPYFYPAAWHGFVAALVQASGAPLPAAVNAANLAIAATAWPLGCMLLTRVLAGNRPVAVAAAGVLSGLFSAFPILLLDYGVLYPNFLSISILPAVLAGVVLSLNLAAGLAVPAAVRAGLPLLTVPGLALAHPNGFMSLLVLCVPLAAQAAAGIFRAGGPPDRRRMLFAAVSTAAAAAVFLALWKFIRPPGDAAFWGPIQSPPGAVLEVLANSPVNRPAGLTVSLLMLVGLVVSRRHRDRYWAYGCFAITLVLFVVVSSLPSGYFRSLITGIWYNDSYRIAALTPITALPFAALGAEAVFRWLRDRSSRSPASRSPGSRGSGSSGARGRRLLPAAAVVLALAAGAAGQFPALHAAVSTARLNYEEDAESPLLTDDEHRVIRQLDAVVPEDAAIAVNPWTGAALAYALADRETTAKHILTANAAEVELLNRELRDAGRNPAVCAAAAEAGVRYALDFGTQEVHGGDHPFPGLTDLESAPGLTLVLEEGDARLYELTGCG